MAYHIAESVKCAVANCKDMALGGHDKCLVHLGHPWFQGKARRDIQLWHEGDDGKWRRRNLYPREE